MPDIQHAIVIEAAPEIVHPLTATADGLAQWWAADVTQKGDNRVDLGFFNRATVCGLQRTRDVAAQQAEWLCLTGNEWQDTRLVFDLKAEHGKTVLRFSHAGWKQASDYFTMCNTTWGELMYRLKAVAEGKRIGPLFSKSGLGY
jgi:uncharacterized protein YndB with AHSA1/START domain